MNIENISTLGQLKAAGYTSKSVKEELRQNLIKKLKSVEKVFDGIHGFDDTVLPDIERAILSRHNILLLGLRGQAKTRIARLLTTLLDEYMPIVAGSEINDDPLAPLSVYARNLIQEKADDTPIEWIHRDDRYVEKLATPDVSIADLIGDIDPIKAATLKLNYSDERVLHFGLIPRANRSIFVINELPDLQARIQVSLFNMLQEGDLQIRGFKLRFPLDLQFVFTANPEDYTNRGSIITPLKDRIESQILTHYPTDISIATQITQQEANIHTAQSEMVHVPPLFYELIEAIAFAARESTYVDAQSGVSARLSISALENLISAAERRALKNGEKETTVRFTDLWGIIPALTGKLELVYEGEQIGPYQVAMNIISEAIKDQFLQRFAHPEADEHETKDPYGTIKLWFSAGNSLDLLNDCSDKQYQEQLEEVAGLENTVLRAGVNSEDRYFFMEFMLNGLSELEVISKSYLKNAANYSDPLGGIWSE